jgi:2-keto-4-pentenoate hydratase/2-oxohepta-3-ene-1,7-dioic acid hydratase in catechol pathway
VALRHGAIVDLNAVRVLPPLLTPSRIICVGLNYVDHSIESGFTPPQYPAVFARFSSSLVGHGSDIVLPDVSDQLDYEGEVAALIEILSEVITLERGDVIVTGTPAGIGLARKPPVFMKDGDICEVEVEQLGILRNTIRRQRGTMDFPSVANIRGAVTNNGQ